MILGSLRVVFGFAIACLAAAATTIGFVIPLESLLAGDQRQWLSAGTLLLYAGTHTAVFAAPFALFAAMIGEWQGYRGWAYYALIGVLIAAAGFWVLSQAEAGGQPTIVNTHAIIAYLVSGLVGGVVYWLIAGRFAGDDEDEEPVRQRAPASAPTTPPVPQVVPPKRPKDKIAPVGEMRPTSVPASKEK